MLHEEQTKLLTKVHNFYLPPKMAVQLAREMQLAHPSISDEERKHTRLPWGETYVVKFYKEDANHRTHPNDIMRGYAQEKGLPISRIGDIERSTMRQNHEMLIKLLDEEIKEASFQIHSCNDSYVWKSDGAKVEKYHQACRFARCNGGFLGVAYYMPHAYKGKEALEMCSFILYAFSKLNEDNCELANGSYRLAKIDKDGPIIISHNNQESDLNNIIDKAIEFERMLLMSANCVVYTNTSSR